MTEQDIFQVRQTDVEIQEILDQVPKNTKAIETINGKLPEEASPENPLADKEYVDGKVTQEVTDRQQAITAEATAREQADQTLDGKIAAEKSRAEGVEQELLTAIGNEAQARQETITAEQTARSAADAQEATAREQADQTLDGKVTQEVTAREQADQTLDGKIAAEKSRAEGVEQELLTAIGNEAQARTQADSQLQALITGVQNALVNYYLKTETYSRTEVQQLIDAVKQFRYEVVATLPATPGLDTMGIIYLVPAADPKSSDVKDEYLTILDGSTYKWEKIGQTTIDLSNYPTTAQMNAAIASALTAYSTTAEMNTAISNAITAALASYYTKTEADVLLATKQASITDGAQIGLGFGTCSTAATTAAKAVSIQNFLLLKNMPVTITFTNAISVMGATLNISSTGAKPIFIQGAALQAGVVKAGDVVTLIYNGTNWNIVEILNVPAAASDLFVDMGLPSGRLWAIANIDVTKQSGFAEVDGKPSPFIYECSFFSWGDTEGHNPTSTSAFDYDWGSSNDGPYASTPGAQLTANAGLSFDAARAILGAPWRDPSTEDFAELFANIDYVQADGETVIDAATTNKLVTVNGIVGIYLKSKVNSKLLFFPCSGYGYGTTWNGRGSNGYYWSRSLYSQTHGRLLHFYSGGVYPQYYSNRFHGFPRRPVQ